MKQAVHLLLTCCVALACSIVLFGTATVKSSHVQAATVNTTVTCSRASCDGLGPSATGCWTSNLRPIATAPILDTSNHSHGTVQLWYSSVCQTNWGQVITSDPCGVNGLIESSYIIRKSGMDGSREEQMGYNMDPGCVEHTPMIWAPDVPVQLTGDIVEACPGNDCVAQYPPGVITQLGF